MPDTTPKHFFKAELEESRMLEAFSHANHFDDCAGIYTSPLLGTMSNEKLIHIFIREKENEQHDGYEWLSQNEASDLLRQMAMFKKGSSNKIKTQLYTPSEAKLETKRLMDFVGNQAEFYTNVPSTDNPHDNPARVLSDDSECTFNCIVFFAFMDAYIIYISQYW